MSTGEGVHCLDADDAPAVVSSWRITSSIGEVGRFVAVLAHRGCVRLRCVGRLPEWKRQVALDSSSRVARGAGVSKASRKLGLQADAMVLRVMRSFVRRRAAPVIGPRRAEPVGASHHEAFAKGARHDIAARKVRLPMPKPGPGAEVRNFRVARGLAGHHCGLGTHANSEIGVNGSRKSERL